MTAEEEIACNRRLAKANEALRSCLDALASVPELDEFLGQVMAAISRQLGAVSSLVRVLDAEQKSTTLELFFKDGQMMSPSRRNIRSAFDPCRWTSWVSHHWRTRLS